MAVNLRFEKYKADLLYYSINDPKVLLSTIIEFTDACNTAKLKIQIGLVKYAKFREILGITI